MLKESQRIEECNITLKMNLKEALELKEALGRISRVGEIKDLYNWLVELK